MNLYPTLAPTEDEPEAPVFTPVPSSRTRHDGWTPERQRTFLATLYDTGLVSAAAAAAGKSVASAYRLRKRPGAQSFAAAWDRELIAARQRALEAAMERIFAPMARPSQYRGNFTGRITVGNDSRVLLAALRAFDLSRHGFGKVEK